MTNLRRALEQLEKQAAKMNHEELSRAEKALNKKYAPFIMDGERSWKIQVSPYGLTAQGSTAADSRYVDPKKIFSLKR